MFCPTLYALGDVGDKRLLNIIYYSYVFLLTGNVFYWCGWFRVRRSAARPAPLSLLFLTAVLCLACLVLHLRNGGYSTVMALGELRSGEAQCYGEAADQRLTVLQDPNELTPALDPYPCTPYLLYFDDITEDPSDWRNIGAAEYYGKNTIVLRTEP